MQISSPTWKMSIWGCVGGYSDSNTFTCRRPKCCTRAMARALAQALRRDETRQPPVAVCQEYTRQVAATACSTASPWPALFHHHLRAPLVLVERISVIHHLPSGRFFKTAPNLPKHLAQSRSNRGFAA